MQTFFFFLSAYFTPTSLDRKGLHDFIADKVKRLGLPVLVWQFGLGQLMLFLSFAFAGMEDEFQWTLSPGPPWFIAWLLAFNLLYAFMAGEPAKVNPHRRTCAKPSIPPDGFAHVHAECVPTDQEATTHDFTRRWLCNRPRQGFVRRRPGGPRLVCGGRTAWYQPNCY